MQKTNKIIEYFWLVFTIASFLFACYAVLFTEGWPAGAKNFIIPAIAFFWWLFRRNMRIRMEKNTRMNDKSGNPA